MPEHLDPGHKRRRATLRSIGPIILVIGLLFTVVGIGSFFASFGSFESPRYFWCVFVGFPLIAVGGSLCKFAYMGAVSRYMAGEVAPVGKDVVNYMADGTKDAVRDVAAAIGEGLSSAHSDRTEQALQCPKCNQLNEASANYCKKCGTPLSKSIACSKCGEPSEADARFCDNCGQPVA